MTVVLISISMVGCSSVPEGTTEPVGPETDTAVERPANFVDADLDDLPAEWSGYFIQRADYHSDGDDTMNVVLVDGAGNSCEEEAALWEVLSGQPLADRRAIWAERRTALYWGATLHLRLSDVDGDLTTADIAERSRFELPGTDSIYATVQHQHMQFDAAFVSGDEPEESYVDRWESDLGTFEITTHVPGKRIAGRFVSDLVIDDTSIDAGPLELGFDVQRCPELERWLY